MTHFQGNGHLVRARLGEWLACPGFSLMDYREHGLREPAAATPEHVAAQRPSGCPLPFILPVSHVPNSKMVLSAEPRAGITPNMVSGEFPPGEAPRRPEMGLAGILIEEAQGGQSKEFIGGTYL